MNEGMKVKDLIENLQELNPESIAYGKLIIKSDDIRIGNILVNVTDGGLDHE